MVWTPPTLADFRTRFPAFNEVPDATVQAVLDEAIATVSTSNFIERDKTPAALYLTAHLLAVEGWLAGAGAGGGGAAVTGTIKRRKVGDVEVEFAGVSGGSGGSDLLAQYMGTIWGQRYVALMRLNSPAILVV